MGIRTARILLSMLTMMLISGCGTTRDDRILADILEDIRNEERAKKKQGRIVTPVNANTYIGADAPDKPDSADPFGASVADASVVNGEAIAIQPACIVQISVKEDASLNGNYHVNQRGAVDLPYIGPVILLNKSELVAARKIKDVLEARLFRVATVDVKILRASYDQVQVMGAVNRPGLIKIGSGDTITLNDVLLQAGGIRGSAKGAKLKIVRDGLLSPLVHTLKGEEYALESEKGNPKVPYVLLSNNDYVTVFSSIAEMESPGGEKQILVLGEVNKPGLYRFGGAEPCTMMNLVLVKMGGLPRWANQKSIKIIRTDNSGKEKKIKLDVRKLLEEGDPEDDFTLEHGDRVIVPARRMSLF